MNCKMCGMPVESDGHGELIHEETAKYGCRAGVKPGEFYPVAS